MFVTIVTVIVAVLLGAVLWPALRNHVQAYWIWKSDLKSIGQWAELDAFERRRMGLVQLIYRRWPKAVAVFVEPGDPISYEERLDFAAGRIGLAPLVRIFRARPEGVRITLDARVHKMEICEARAFKIAISVIAAPQRPARVGRPGPGDEAIVAPSATRHGRREERVKESPTRISSVGRS